MINFASVLSMNKILQKFPFKKQRVSEEILNKQEKSILLVHPYGLFDKVLRDCFDNKINIDFVRSYDEALYNVNKKDYDFYLINYSEIHNLKNLINEIQNKDKTLDKVAVFGHGNTSILKEYGINKTYTGFPWPKFSKNSVEFEGFFKDIEKFLYRKEVLI